MVERGFDGRAKAGYAVADTAAEKSDPNAGSPGQSGSAHGRGTSGVEIVIQLGSLRRSHAVEVFSGHTDKNAE
jgi:hypothetical protein